MLSSSSYGWNFSSRKSSRLMGTSCLLCLTGGKFISRSSLPACRLGRSTVPPHGFLWGWVTGWPHSAQPAPALQAGPDGPAQCQAPPLDGRWTGARCPLHSSPGGQSPQGWLYIWHRFRPRWVYPHAHVNWFRASRLQAVTFRRWN